jgi:methylmalonyl-CoA mutase N-terminal domain/subunit
VAFTVANGIAYVEAAKSTGLDVNRLGQRLSFFFAAHNNFLEEIAKFRAARRLWAHVMRDRFGASDPRAMQLRFHTQTAGSTLAAQQPDNNIVRVAIQALAAVLGGTQSLHCNGRDEALGLPTEASAEIALRTQQILAAETGVVNTVDPVGGSWAIEAKTDEIVREASELIGTIDAMGGALGAIEQGWIQGQVQESAYRAQRAIEDGNEIVVGMNRYTTGDPPAIEAQRLDPSLEERQKAAVAAVRQSRDAEGWRRAMADVRQSAGNGANLVPPIIRAVEARATLGEIADILREAFGEHREQA